MIKRILLRTGHYRICKGRKIQDDDKIISVAKITAKEYYMEKYNDKKTSQRQVVELCDVVEVVYALIKVQGMSLEDFERLRLEKASINGIFEKRIFLSEIIDQAC